MAGLIVIPEWAKTLCDLEASGERLTLAQRMEWRQAYGLPVTAVIPSWEQTPEEYANGLPGNRGTE